MLFRRRSKKRSSRIQTDEILVDLDNYDVKGDITVTKVKVIDVNDMTDMEKVSPFIGHGDVLFINMSRYRGTQQDFDSFIESMRSQARATKYKLYDAGNGYFVMASDDAIVKRL